MKVGNKVIWDYIMVLGMILISGGVFFFMMYAIIFVPLFFICSLLYFIRFQKQIDGYNSRLLFFFILYYLVSYHIVASQHINGQYNTYIVYQFLLLSSYFLISTITFDEFKKCYTNLCCGITLFSILLFIMVIIDIVKPISFNNYLMVLLDVYGESRVLGRLHGPFWEPGVLQIILNIALIFNIDSLTSITKIKKQIRKFSIIIVGILLTISTAGYVNLMLIGVVCLIFSKVLKKNVFITISLLSCAFFILYLLFSSEAIQGKLSQQGEEETSYEIRMADNLGMINMTKERPIFGYGLASKEYDDRSWYMDNRTSSNGLLFITSHLGIPFLLFYLFFIYVSVRRLFKKSLSLMLFPIVLLLQMTEVFFYFPLSYVFVFRFKNKK